MATTELTYSANPRQVAVSTGGAPSQISMTITIANQTSSNVELASVSFTLPQGTDPGDLLAPSTSFSVGNVQSSNGTSWSPGASNNVVTLLPVSSQGYETLAPNDTLMFTLSQMQITTAGAGQPATIQVSETIFDSAPVQGGITIDKFNPGFQIEAFYASLYNVDANDPVTITWKVFQALSCEVTAQILNVAGKPGTPMTLKPRNPGPCGVGTDNPSCDGTVVSGTDFDDSRTCNVIGATLFTMTASGASNGQDVNLTSQLIVTVNRPAINFGVFPPVVDLGQIVSLSWVAADAAKLLLYIVPQTGTPPPPIDLTKTPSGTRAETPIVNTNYTLYAFERATDTQPARQESQSVVVEPPSWVEAPAVSNLPVPAYPGDTFTLGWRVDNVASCDLTCDVASFTPLSGLSAEGPQQVTIPDPGVPQQTANFLLTPIEYGTLGHFTPKPFQVPIQNTPNFSTPLTPNANNGSPGATINLTWAVDHVDGAGTLTSDYSGASPIPIPNPASGQQAVVLPNGVIPTPINYTLAVSRESGKYPATSATRVQMNGTVNTQWCAGKYSGGGGQNYLGGLYNRFPNQRITKIGLGFEQPDSGVYGIWLWYSQNANPDYGITTPFPGNIQETLALNAGEYLVGMAAQFADVFTDDEVYMSGLFWVQFSTSQGRSIQIGSQIGGSCVQQAPSGQQVIALGWGNNNGRGYVDTLGIITCPAGYGG
jgi:hypothetical protein